ncbi:AI-2E family transporter [Candidatus Xianfuyuplasma coldseepsis]|uniref:AI-2E family transporter n=1 Tax=Candidatus Xianfuyuplasma coldseepsis TaxID=2782163 RepID=A0A7L7KU84_9MOLU|nr:AI-2E family transporter [Xianfuyuplasma coldseepsis]QMS85862.1 AI-2E family transporter [Xianfuyuplasma coldseepsis]
MTEKKRTRILQNLGILTLSLVSLYYINQLFNDQLEVFRTAINSIVVPFGIALFLSYLVEPMLRLLEKHMKVQNRLLAVVIVFIIITVAIVLFLYFVGIIIYEQGVSFFENDWDNIVLWVNKFIDQNPSIESAYQSLQDYISFDNASPVIFNVVNIVRSIGSIVIIIVLIPVFLFFLLKEKETIFEGIVSVVPKKYKHHTRELGQRANDVIQKYFNGRFLVMFIMSIALTIMFMAFGFNFQRSLFFGFTLGFLDIIPYIGGFIGMTLPILYSFTVQDTLLLGEWTFIGLIAVNLIIQGIQGNILQPYIMGKEVNMHPLLVLSSFIFFGALFGIAGVILAIPITGIIKASAQYFNELKEDEETQPKKSSPKPKKLAQK